MFFFHINIERVTHFFIINNITSNDNFKLIERVERDQNLFFYYHDEQVMC